MCVNLNQKLKNRLNNSILERDTKVMTVLKRYKVLDTKEHFGHKETIQYLIEQLDDI